MKRHIQLAKDGDLSSLEILVDSLRPRLARMAARYASWCGEDQDDLLQDAWLGLLEAIPNIQIHIGDPSQHLIQRARWRMLDSIKRSKVRRCSPLDETTNIAVSITDEHATGGVHVSDFATRLSPKQREVFDCLLDGLTWREAGKALGCTSANIAYYVRQIRNHYKEWDSEGEILDV